MRHALNVWPPFAASGIRVEHIGADFRTARVALHHRWWARNYVGTLFGGALFAMTDVVAEDGTVVARVRKQLHIRQRREVSERVDA